MKEHKCVARFKGHKVRNDYKVIVSVYDNPLQPWNYLVYDSIKDVILSVPKKEMWHYVHAELFTDRRLFTTGRELENLFCRTSPADRTVLRTPDTKDTVCFLKRKYACAGEPNYASMTTLNPAVAKQVDWLAPHTCQELKHNLSDTDRTLLITVPEFKSVVLANPEYFDVKEKTR